RRRRADQAHEEQARQPRGLAPSVEHAAEKVGRPTEDAARLGLAAAGDVAARRGAAAGRGGAAGRGVAELPGDARPLAAAAGDLAAASAPGDARSLAAAAEFTADTALLTSLGIVEEAAAFVEVVPVARHR